MRTKFLVALACGVIAASTLPVLAGEPVDGPAVVPLKDADAQIKLPAGYAFIPKEQAVKALEDEGSTGEGVQGLILPTAKDGNNWIVICRFDDSGYVNDDDANKLNPDDILKSYKDGTEEQNEVRKEKGIPPVYVGGWAEKPRYEKAKHQVIWAIQGKDEDKADAPIVTVNYNTRILGRRGVLSMNLVTDPDKVELNKTKVGELLNQTTFNKGADYKDYVAGKDKAAGYGLAGLILGGGALAAAAKLGLLGGLWKWGIGLLLVFKKFAIVGIAAIAAGASKIFGKKKDSGNGPSGTA
jgi:uncharacterized membrane-anchored protein